MKNYCYISDVCVMFVGMEICVSPIGWKTLRCYESFRVLWLLCAVTDGCFGYVSVSENDSPPVTLRDNLTAMAFCFFFLKLEKRNDQNFQEV